MRILHVAESVGGGVFEVVRTLAERMAGTHDVAIAYGIRPETPRNVRAVVDDSVEIFALPWLSRSFSAQVRAAHALRKLGQSWRPDLVHLHSSFAGAVGTVSFRRTPTIYTPHGYSFTMEGVHRLGRQAYRRVERVVSRQATVVAVVSPHEAQLARTAAGARRVAVVGNGIPELDNPASVDATKIRPPTVVAMGRLTSARQPEAVARILGAAADFASVTWVGGGASGAPGLRALRQAGVPVTGWLPREAAMEFLGRATAYVHWTAWDGRPLSILEAMARDAVVVASDIPANRELLSPEQVCSDEGGAVALLRAIVTGTEVRERLLGFQRANRSQHSAERMVSQWLQLYARTAQELGSSGQRGRRGVRPGQLAYDSQREA
jgi:glycosyltransferase involved in cell wall biosynthesis